MRRPQLDQILHTMLGSQAGISDLVFATGRPLQVESDGVLQGVTFQPELKNLSPYQTEQIALNVVGENPRLLRELLGAGACDCAYTTSEGVRFRANVYRQRGSFSVVMRRTQAIIPTLASLSLPAVFNEICLEKNGLILVTGATGSGKTTTLTAILDAINAASPVHIITLEDPIEFVHEQNRATFSQRELGTDFADFPTGLRSALRQAPKVILVGEMRDRATVEIALSAAETGHLVLSTLPTINAGQTVNRLMGMLDHAEHAHLRLRLVETLRYVISQRLVPKIGGGRQLVQEILGTNMRVREALAQGEGEGRSFYDIIENSSQQGWLTFDQALLRAYIDGTIEEETALLYSTQRNRLTRMLDEARKRQGQLDNNPMNLRLDAHAPVPGRRFA